MEFKKIYWDDVRKQILKVNPKLAKIIDKISPDNNHYFYRGTYPYGAYILHRGSLQVPIGNELFSLSDERVPKTIRNDLNYNLGTNPVSLVLENSVEIFCQIENSILPLYGVILPANVFSTSRVLTPRVSNALTFYWHMTAGARSIFIPQKLSNKRYNDVIRRHYELSVDPPRTMFDQWYAFREIANHSSWGDPWNTKILFFTSDWFSHMEDPAWQDFYFYLYQSAWLSSDYNRNQFQWDMLFSEIHRQGNIKPSPYIEAITRHLFAIGVGAAPGFAQATDNRYAPIDRLFQCYQELYKDMLNPSMILVPSFYKDDDVPVYLSLNIRTWANSPPKQRDQPSLINELINTSSLLKKYMNSLEATQFNIAGSSLDNLVKNTGIRFFHGGKDNFHNINPSPDIIKYDNYLAIEDNETLSSSPFFRACIQVYKK